MAEAEKTSRLATMVLPKGKDIPGLLRDRCRVTVSCGIYFNVACNDKKPDTKCLATDLGVGEATCILWKRPQAREDVENWGAHIIIEE